MVEDSTFDRLEQLKRQAFVGRLRTGARYLGDVYRQGARCGGGWSGLCPCVEPKGKFCLGKLRWISLLLELHSDTWPYGANPSDPYAVIEAMTTSQFDATGLTMMVESLPAKKPIKIGLKGTSWDTIHDLTACATIPGVAPGAVADALEAIVKIQSVM